MHQSEPEIASTQILDEFRRVHDQVLSAVYQKSIAESGHPLEFRLFDAQICGHLDLSWLSEQTKSGGISEGELQQLIDAELIHRWSDRKGKKGFLLYTPEQVKTLVQLRQAVGYSDPELRHVMEKWDEDISCTLEVLPYDDLELSEFDAYRLRLNREIEELCCHVKWLTEADLTDDDSRASQLNEAKDRLRASEDAARRADSYDPNNLSENVRLRISQSLFGLRWIDEYVRVCNANQFQTVIREGFSPEVVFSSYTSGINNFEFHTIDWHMTLEAVKAARSQGRRFPLRTPEFDLTEQGLKLPHLLSAEEYATVHTRYQIGRLSAELDKFGKELWNPATQSGRPVCAECRLPFVRTLPTKRYCSDKCRSRARQRRWRESDPERARQAQARYWKNYAPDDEPPGGRNGVS
jgi:hypothetical protein